MIDLSDALAAFLGAALPEEVSPEAVLGLTPTQLLGIPLAILGAVCMSFGAKYQHRGVSKVEVARDRDAEPGARADDLEANRSDGLGVTQLGALLRRPSWLIGTAMLGLAIVLQLSSLSFAPLVVVQPLGVVSLVLTTILTAVDSGRKLSRGRIIAVALCVVGVATFVTLAAANATERYFTTLRISIVLIVLGVVVAIFATAFALLRRRFKALFHIVGAGVIYGFVATLAKITINRLQHGEFGWLSLLCIAMLIIGAAVGAYFVQTAYATGSPDMVIAGLTVIDPLVAVLIGILVLGETDGAPWWTYLGFAIAGAVAVAGVLLLERGQTAEEVAATRAAAARDRGARRDRAADGRARG